MKKFFSLLGIAVLGGAITLGGYKMLFNESSFLEQSNPDSLQTFQTNYTPAYTDTTNAINLASIDFTVAAEKTVNSVFSVICRRYKRMI